MTWFRIGSLQVTTTVFVALLGAVGMIAGTVSSALLSSAALVPDQLFAGEVWRLVTWPWIDRLSFWGILSLLLFWYFGKMLEEELGRNTMASFLFGLWGILTASHVVAGLLLPGLTILVGLGMIQTLLILLFIMEQPNRPFFFGIPAWAIGAILIGLQIVGLAATSNIGGLVALLLSLGGTAIWARRHGLLTSFPGLRTGPRPRPKPKKAPSKPSNRAASRRKVELDDEQRLDQLLDKINATGMDSLSSKERDELQRISERRLRR